jgi:hypothetical protein
MINNEKVKIRTYSLAIVLILILVAVTYSVVYPVKYGIQYLLSYSNEKVDHKLTKEFGPKLIDAGIVEITNKESALKAQSKIVFVMDDIKYSKEDQYNQSKLKNSWITFDGERIKFVGKINVDHRKMHSSYDEYDAGYLAGKEAIETALNHIEDIKHHVTRDLIKMSKQKIIWDEKAES